MRWNKLEAPSEFLKRTNENLTAAMSKKESCDGLTDAVYARLFEQVDNERKGSKYPIISSLTQQFQRQLSWIKQYSEIPSRVLRTPKNCLQFWLPQTLWKWVTIRHEESGYEREGERKHQSSAVENFLIRIWHMQYTSRKPMSRISWSEFNFNNFSHFFRRI